MLKLPYDQLASLARWQLCAEHGTPVGVAWHKDENCWTIRCDEGHYPDALIRNLTLTESWKAGEPIPLEIEQKIKQKEVKKAVAQNKEITDAKLALIPQADLGTGELLVPDQVKAIIGYAQGYGLDPFRGHVVLMYSKPYITLDGYLWYANRCGEAYRLSSKPLTDEERHTYNIGEGDHAWLAEITMAEGDRFFTGLGIVTKDEMTAKSKRDTTKLASPVVAAHPWQLAQKRAEWQALRRAFPIGETEEKPSDSSDKTQSAEAVEN